MHGRSWAVVGIGITWIWVMLVAGAGEVAAQGNSLLVTFDLTPSGAGTLLKMTETGFRERGWGAAVLEEQYHEHGTGWDFYLPRLAPYVDALRIRQ